LATSGGGIEDLLRQKEIAEALSETVGEVFETPVAGGLGSWPRAAGPGSLDMRVNIRRSRQINGS